MMGRKKAENPKDVGIAFRLTKPEAAEVDAMIAKQPPSPPGAEMSRHDWARAAYLNWARAANGAKIGRAHV